MWSRRTTDPLGKLLFQKYGMHVLSRPRENVSVLQVFAFHNDQFFQSGSLDAFLRTKVERPDIGKDEAQLDIDTTVSDAVSGRLGLNFLQGFLALLGIGAVNAVSASFEKSQSDSLRFRFGGCTRDYVLDGFDLDWKLSEVVFDKNKSAMKDDGRYYIVTGVHFCNELTFELLDKNQMKVDLSADLALVGGVKSGLSISKDKQITAKSNKKLAYGVELNELVYDEKRNRLQLEESKSYVHVKARRDAVLPKAMIGGPTGSLLVPIAD